LVKTNSNVKKYLNLLQAALAACLKDLDIGFSQHYAIDLNFHRFKEFILSLQ